MFICTFAMGAVDKLVTVTTAALVRPHNVCAILFTIVLLARAFVDICHHVSKCN